MTEVWELPEDRLLQPTGPDWLIHLLHAIPENQRARTLMVIWRIWHAHNEMTHNKPCPPIESSRRFLVSYSDSLMLIKQFPDADISKGKMVVDHHRGFKKNNKPVEDTTKVKMKWIPPGDNEVKLNVDGAFSREDRAGIGILRDQQGAVIFTACRQLQKCRDATEAEIMAIEEGVTLALQWTDLRLIVESDCSTVVELITGTKPNRSAYTFRINVIRELLRERGSRLAKISRDANMVSHGLAQLGKVHGRTQVWLHESPSEVTEAITSDCNLNSS
jgi:ribonuclease HI